MRHSWPSPVAAWLLIWDCRSGPKTLEYYAQCATGQVWATTLWDVAMVLSSGDQLEWWGLRTVWSAEELSSLDAEHPVVETDQAVAAEAGTLMLQTVRHCCRGHLPQSHQWPGKLAALGLEDPAVREECHKEMQQDLEILADANKKASKLAWWPMRLKRSFFSQPLTRDIFKAAASGG